MLTAHLLHVTNGRAARATFLAARKEQPDLSSADARKQSGVLLPIHLGSLGGCGTDEALARAGREQLTLEPAKRKDNTTGFQGVSPHTHRTSDVLSFVCRLPRVMRGGKWINGDCIGTCTTAVEAALLLARAKAARARAEVL